MAKLVGYARVSTSEQEVELQLDALRQAGCANEHIFIDKASGARSERPGLDACLRLLKPGDTLLVWRLIQERTKAGLSAARARGRKGGRKPISSDDPRVQMAKRMYHNHGMSINRICRTLKISRATFYRYIALPDKTN
jgi:DNA invertase Pin-like site-specific DNA recombinase